jgi:hypothetical protein
MNDVYIVRWLHHPGIEGVFENQETAHAFGEAMAATADDSEDSDCTCISVEQWSVSNATKEQAKATVERIMSQHAAGHPIPPKDLN